MPKRQANYNGLKLYKAINDNEVEVIRVIRRKSDKVMIAQMDGEPDTRREYSVEEIKEYRPLNPHGVFIIAIVQVGKHNALEDVVAMIGRASENTDYAMCRQNIVNPYYQSLSGIKRFGVALSRDNCPSYVSYDDAKGFDKLIKSYNISIYRDDTIDSILDIASSAEAAANKILLDTKQKFKKNDDFCSSLKELFERHSFWDMFDSMFEITSMPGLVMTDDIGREGLSLTQLYFLQDKISHYMLEVEVITYWYDLDFSKIITDFMLIRDDSGSVYVVQYQKGEFIKPQHLSDEEIAKFSR